MQMIQVNLSETFLVFYSVEVRPDLIDFVKKVFTSRLFIPFALKVPRIAPPRHDLKL